jgi:putative (di)nucleoside polyphosphate hydrolase
MISHLFSPLLDLRNMNSRDEPASGPVSEAAIRYRPNVAAILQNGAGRILICERIDIPGAWQFPQGGVEPGETHALALEREMDEELSLVAGDYKIISHKGPYRYVIGGGRSKRGYQGQEQEYFLLELLAPESRINVHTADREFRSCRWILPAEFDLGWLPAMKREVYQQVMKDFFGVGATNSPMD